MVEDANLVVSRLIEPSGDSLVELNILHVKEAHDQLYKCKPSL